MARDTYLQLKMSTLGWARLHAHAEAIGTTPPLAAKALLEAALAEFALSVPNAAQAEGELLEQVKAIADEYRDRNDWDEHVTLEVFRRIRQNLRSTYDAAIAGGNRVRLNREIGRQVRIALGASVRTDHNGRVKFGQVPRAGELIKTYTLLYRPEEV